MDTSPNVTSAGVAETSPVNGPPSGQFRLRYGAKALVTSASKVLLVQEHHADGRPFWTFPGGGVCPGEQPEDGLTRELREELDCDVRIGSPVTQFWYVHESLDATVSRYTVFDCALVTDPTPDRSEGIAAYEWVSPARLPQGTLPQVRHVCRQVADLPAATVAADD